MNVLMLDHEPMLAAQYHCDAHVSPSILSAAQLLSTAWHQHANTQYWELEAVEAGDLETPWFKRHVEPPTTGKEQPPVSRKAAAPGEMPSAWWLLHGQRVYNSIPYPECDEPLALWAREQGGNYLWLWRYAMALCDEHQHRTGRRHERAPVVWALEPVPFALEATRDTWSEVPPQLPEHLKVTVDGYYDSVASYRNLYIKHADTLAWTNRPVPAWLTQQET